MYKSPSSVETFNSVMKANRKEILGAAAVIGATALAGSMVADNLNAITGTLGLIYGGLPALALAQNASKLKAKFSEKFFPEKFKQQQQDVRARVDQLVSGNSEESVLAVANDALDKNMISESKFSAILRKSGYHAEVAISALDRLTENHKPSEVKAVVANTSNNYEPSMTDYEPSMAKP